MGFRSTPAARAKIRPARKRDAERIALLAGQLGYPSSTARVLQRLDRIKGNNQHAVFVAESKDGRVVGWLHVFVGHLVESDPYAEIGGLVVDELHRSAGIGRLLLQRAEAWAHAKGCQTVRLRSNIIRKEAHEFYLKRGYNLTKTQHAFAKTL